MTQVVRILEVVEGFGDAGAFCVNITVKANRRALPLGRGKLRIRDNKTTAKKRKNANKDDGLRRVNGGAPETRLLLSRDCWSFNSGSGTPDWFALGASESQGNGRGGMGQNQDVTTPSSVSSLCSYGYPRPSVLLRLAAFVTRN